MKRICAILGLMIALMGMAAAQYRDVKLPESPKQDPYKHYEMQERGIWFAVDLDGGSSVQPKDNMQYAELTLAGGYRLSQYLRLGAGFGARFFVAGADVREQGGLVGIPLFVNARGNIIPAYDRDLVPYWQCNAGIIAGDGLYLNPAFGISTGGVRNTFHLALSYTLASFTNNQSASATYSYFGLKLGYEF